MICTHGLLLAGSGFFTISPGVGDTTLPMCRPPLLKIELTLLLLLDVDADFVVDGEPLSLVDECRILRRPSPGLADAVPEPTVMASVAAAAAIPATPATFARFACLSGRSSCRPTILTFPHLLSVAEGHWAITVSECARGNGNCE